MTCRPTVALLATIFALALMAPSAHAQRGFRGVGGRFAGRGQSRNGNFGLGWGYLPPPYYYSPDGTGYGAPAQPQFVPYPVFQQPTEPAPEAKPIEPLLIEEQGGQWVRVQKGGELPTASPSAQESATSSTAPKLPSAVIVFRDGRQEEVAKYMIQGSTLYTSADYWSTGTWTRKIRVADLDVPATLKLNQDRGTKFNLPSSPSEVMIRF